MSRARALVGEDSFLEIRDGENEDQIILDPETGLEQTLMACGCLPVLLASGLFFAVISGDAPPWMMGIAVLIFAVGMLSFYLRSALDDHYIVDFAKNEVFFHRKFGTRTHRRSAARFSDLHSLVLYPQRESQKSGVTWYYGLSLYTQQGGRIPVITPHHRKHEDLVKAGESLAEALKLKFEAGPPERLLKVSQTHQGPTFEFVPYSWLTTLLKVSALMFVLVGIGYFLSELTL